MPWTVGRLAVQWGHWARQALVVLCLHSNVATAR